MDARFFSSNFVAANVRAMILSAMILVVNCLAFTDFASAQYGRPVILGVHAHGMSGAGRPIAFGASPTMSGPTQMASAATTPSSQAGGSANFIVLCNDPRLTQVVSQTAERLRKELAIHWLGEELPDWSRRCPIHVISGPSLGAGGETRFTLYEGNVGNWDMTVQGSVERILDSVLPHEITHTIFASHFAPLNTHVPRWADEGACTTVEHSSEQNKHKEHLLRYLKTRRGLSFNLMFSLTDYPTDILPLYAQGHSVVEFLIAQGGPRKFVQFLSDGMQTQGWEKAVERAYGYSTLGQLQTNWNQWVAKGRGEVDAYVAIPRPAKVELASVPSVPSLEISRTGELVDFPEGARIDLAGFRNPVRANEIGSVNLVASNATVDTQEQANKPLDASAQAIETNSPRGYFGRRLESSAPIYR